MYVLIEYHIPTHIHVYNFISQILMNVLMEQIPVLKYVLTLKEVSFVNVIVVIYWILIRVPVMVCGLLYS